MFILGGGGAQTILGQDEKARGKQKNQYCSLFRATEFKGQFPG